MDEDDLVKTKDDERPHSKGSYRPDSGRRKELTPSERSVTKSPMNKVRAFSLSFSLEG
jgi:hypothetical protein